MENKQVHEVRIDVRESIEADIVDRLVEVEKYERIHGHTSRSFEELSSPPAGYPEDYYVDDCLLLGKEFPSEQETFRYELAKGVMDSLTAVVARSGLEIAEREELRRRALVLLQSFCERALELSSEGFVSYGDAARSRIVISTISVESGH